MGTQPEHNLMFEDDGVTVTSSPASDGNGTVLTLRMNRGKNWFNPKLNASLNAALNVIEEQDHPKALIITGGQGSKFFSNGLDLEYMQSHDNDTVNTMIKNVWLVFARILIMDCRTVAAINGHAFGAGLFLTLACDYRVMRTKRGYLNWPELNLGVKLGKGFAELTKAKVSNPDVIREAVLNCKRYSSSDAWKRRLIDEECDIEDLQSCARILASKGFAHNLNLQFFNPTGFQQMKMELYTDAYRALTLGVVDSLPQSRL